MFRLVVISALAVLVYGRAHFVHRLTPTLEGRIVGGKNTTIEEHPYQVALEVYGMQICGGSLIAPNIVVTSALCTEDLAHWLNYLAIRAGSTHESSGGQVINVASINDHPKYNRSNGLYDYDVSVLVLNASFNLSAAVQLISLQPADIEVGTGKLGTVTGWGTNTIGGSSSATLQAVDVPKVDQAACQSDYPWRPVTSRMHCFGYKEEHKGICQGDFGGPLAVDGRLAGVVSWGFGCTVDNLVGVYVKVANKEIADHINDVVAKFK